MFNIIIIALNPSALPFRKTPKPDFTASDNFWARARSRPPEMHLQLTQLGAELHGALVTSGRPRQTGADPSGHHPADVFLPGDKQQTSPAGRHSNAATRGPALYRVKSHLKAPLGVF